jgi:hypothetical protein
MIDEYFFFFKTYSFTEKSHLLKNVFPKKSLNYTISIKRQTNALFKCIVILDYVTMLLHFKSGICFRITMKSPNGLSLDYKYFRHGKDLYQKTLLLVPQKRSHITSSNKVYITFGSLQHICT